jgi:hypothetical protein
MNSYAAFIPETFFPTELIVSALSVTRELYCHFAHETAVLLEDELEFNDPA